MMDKIFIKTKKLSPVWKKVIGNNSTSASLCVLEKNIK